MRDAFGFPPIRGWGKAYRLFSDADMEEVPLREFKVSLLQLCTAKALTNIDVADEGFNRHST